MDRGETVLELGERAREHLFGSQEHILERRDLRERAPERKSTTAEHIGRPAHRRVSRIWDIEHR